MSESYTEAFKEGLIEGYFAGVLAPHCQMCHAWWTASPYWLRYADPPHTEELA